MEVGVRNRWLALLLLAAALIVPGCNRNRRKVIAVIPKGTSHLFWVSVQAGALAAGKDFNVDINWNGPVQETEYDRQVQIMDSMVAQHVDGIALAVTERQALVPPLERAVAAGIPVTVFDSGIDSDKYMTFVATNNYEAGQMAARTLAGLIGDKGNVGLLANAPGSGSTMDRERGFTDVIKTEFPNIHIVATQFGMSDRAKARASAENILTANPDLAGLFASAEPSSVGAALALKAMNRSGKTKFVAFDSSDSMIEDLKGGTISAMVVQDPFHMGYEAVKTVVDKLNGKTPAKRMDLHARVITKADLDKPEIQQLLHPDISKYIK
jgi:ribose transport system substrate-binding protein